MPRRRDREVPYGMKGGDENGHGEETGSEGKETGSEGEKARSKEARSEEEITFCTRADHSGPATAGPFFFPDDRSPESINSPVATTAN